MKKLPAVLMLLLACTTAGADDGAVLVRDTGLREAPRADAGVVAELAAETGVRVLERSGGWYRVRDEDDNTGWARLLSLRFDEAQRSTLQEEADSLRRFGSGKTTAVTGIRGLAAADGELREVEETALGPVHEQAIGRDEARDFAARGGLESRDIPASATEERK